MMDQREFVRRNYVKLTNAIAPSVESVVTSLFNQGIITQHMRGNVIENNNPNHKKTWALLDLIVTRGPRALDYLYNAVVAENLYEAADILKPENGPHAPVVQPQPHTPTAHTAQAQPHTGEYDSPDEGLPDSWPSFEVKEANNSVRKITEKHTRMINLFKASHTPRGQEFTYLMSAKPRGRVLVINNEKFLHMENRHGSLEDRKTLEPLFQELGFDTDVVKDKTKENMWKLLVEESENEYHRNAQCFVLIILTHGHTGVVFGTDGRLTKNVPENCLEIKAITDLFCKSKNLQGKPKLFFIQACQGAEKNEGHPVGLASEKPAADHNKGATNDLTPSDAAVAPSNVECTKQQEAEIQRETKATLSDIFPTTYADAAGDKIPSGADVFVALATVPGFLSYRNINLGTWFIQAICYVFARYAYKYELNKLMTLVNNLVGRAETEKGRYKQVCEKKDSFQKDFYFFPGLADD